LIQANRADPYTVDLNLIREIGAIWVD